MEPRIRVAGILIKDKELLLVRHQKGNETYWLLPGGGVDYGETMEESLIREFQEECNIEVDVEDMIFISQGIAPDKSKHLLQTTFLVKHKAGEVKIGEEDILKEAKYFSIDEIDNITLYPNLKEELKNYFAGDKGTKYLGHRWE